MEKALDKVRSQTYEWFFQLPSVLFHLAFFESDALLSSFQIPTSPKNLDRRLYEALGKMVLINNPTVYQ